MSKESLRERVEKLEQRVRELEARPPQVVQVPVYVPYQPVPSPYVNPWWQTVCSENVCVDLAAAPGATFTTGQWS